MGRQGGKLIKYLTANLRCAGLLSLDLLVDLVYAVKYFSACFGLLCVKMFCADASLQILNILIQGASSDKVPHTYMDWQWMF